MTATPTAATVVAFGTYDVGRHPRFGVVLEGLREHGIVVRELNRPIGLSTAQRVRMLEQPWRVVGLLVRLLGCWAGLVRDALPLRGRRRPDVVLVGYLGHFDVLLARLLFPRSRIVLDQLIFGADTARDRRATGGVLLAALGVLDRVSVAAADVVVVDTDLHLDLIPAARRDRGLVIPVGAPRSWYAQPPGGAERSGPLRTGPLRVVFFGTFTPLQGAAHIADAVAQMSRRGEGAAVELTMIGDGQDGDRVRELLEGVDVRRIAWVEPDELPALVAAHDVCLGIFGTTPKALRVVPNKVYQGLAAGLAVITSDTPPQRQALGDAAVLVPPGDPAALAAALTQIAADPARLAELRTAARERAVLFAPDAVVRPLLELVS